MGSRPYREKTGSRITRARSALCQVVALPSCGGSRRAVFLPWRSDEIPVEKRISPLRASALLLEYLRAAWEAKFAGEGHRFDAQEITITVPASFDAVAQRLTMDAAREAGFPGNVRLLEEPQAAFLSVARASWRTGGHLDPAPGGRHPSSRSH